MSKLLFWTLVIVVTGPFGVIAALAVLALRGIGVRPWR